MLKIVLFISLFFLYLNAKEYIISYKAAVHNAILLNEKLSVSPSMQQCKGKGDGNEIIFDNPKHLKSLYKVLSQNSELFYNYIMKQAFVIRSFESVSSRKIDSLLLLRLPPTCFTVNFNEDFVTIQPLKK